MEAAILVVFGAAALVLAAVLIARNARAPTERERD